MSPRPDFRVGGCIPVSCWGPFWVSRVWGSTPTSDFYDGFFGKRIGHPAWTIQVVRPHAVAPAQLRLFESQILQMTRLTERPIRHVEGLFRTAAGPDRHLVVFQRDPPHALPLHRFLEIGALRRLALVRHVARAIFRSLDEIHDNELVHDDIRLETIFVKCERVLWRETLHLGLRRQLQGLWGIGIHNFEEGGCEPNLYLRGFGVDRLLDQTRALDGAHAAPERLAGAPPTPRSDIYSLGVVLHELLLGRRHPPGRPPAFLDPGVQGVPPLVAALVMRALDPSPKSRPEKAADWAAAFEEAFAMGIDDDERMAWTRGAP